MGAPCVPGAKPRIAVRPRAAAAAVDETVLTGGLTDHPPTEPCWSYWLIDGTGGRSGNHQHRERGARADGITASMGSLGDCFDNYHQARLAVFDWIETLYDRRRRHSALGYLSPEAYEQKYLTTAA